MRIFLIYYLWKQKNLFSQVISIFSNELFDNNRYSTLTVIRAMTFSFFFFFLVLFSRRNQKKLFQIEMEKTFHYEKRRAWCWQPTFQSLNRAGKLSKFTTRRLLNINQSSFSDQNVLKGEEKNDKEKLNFWSQNRLCLIDCKSFLNFFYCQIFFIPESDPLQNMFWSILIFFRKNYVIMKIFVKLRPCFHSNLNFIASLMRSKRYHPLDSHSCSHLNGSISFVKWCRNDVL